MARGHGPLARRGAGDGAREARSCERAAGPRRVHAARSRAGPPRNAHGVRGRRGARAALGGAARRGVHGAPRARRQRRRCPRARLGAALDRRHGVALRRRARHRDESAAGHPRARAGSLRGRASAAASPPRRPRAAVALEASGDASDSAPGGARRGRGSAGGAARGARSSASGRQRGAHRGARAHRRDDRRSVSSCLARELGLRGGGGRVRRGQVAPADAPRGAVHRRAEAGVPAVAGVPRRRPRTPAAAPASHARARGAPGRGARQRHRSPRALDPRRRLARAARRDVGGRCEGAR